MKPSEIVLHLLTVQMNTECKPETLGSLKPITQFSESRSLFKAIEPKLLSSSFSVMTFSLIVFA